MNPNIKKFYERFCERIRKFHHDTPYRAIIEYIESFFEHNDEIFYKICDVLPERKHVDFMRRELNQDMNELCQNVSDRLFENISKLKINNMNLIINECERNGFGIFEDIFSLVSPSIKINSKQIYYLVYDLLKYRSFDAIDFLIEKGFDVDCNLNRNEERLIFKIIELNDILSLDFLLSRGVHPNMVTCDKKGPIFRALELKQHECVQVIFKTKGFNMYEKYMELTPFEMCTIE